MSQEVFIWSIDSEWTTPRSYDPLITCLYVIFLWPDSGKGLDPSNWIWNLNRLQEALYGLRQETPPRELLRTPPCISPSSGCHNISQNWNNSSAQYGSGRSSSRGGSSSSSTGGLKKVPPEVPKRTSSISSRSMESRHHNGLSKSVENGSLSSVQSSGSDSTNCESSEGGDPQRGSPIWKHKAIVGSF